MRLAFPFVVVAAAIAAVPAHGQSAMQNPVDVPFNGKSDWELEQEKLNWKESGVKLPAYPKTEDLVEFFVSGATNFRFYIDPTSLTAGPDGVVRYTFVARSPSGVPNVSFEGMRCATNSYKLYALGNDGRWSARETEWREIEARAVQRWHIELRSRYFCPGNAPIRTAAEGVGLLRNGGYRAGADAARGN